jgi:hypothetical protein
VAEPTPAATGDGDARHRGEHGAEDGDPRMLLAHGVQEPAAPHAEVEHRQDQQVGQRRSQEVSDADVGSVHQRRVHVGQDLWQ